MRYLSTLIFALGLLTLSNCNEEDLKPPAKPELVSPTDGTTDAELNLTFNWNVTKDAKSYGFQLSVTSDFTSTEINSSGIEELSISVDNLMPDTKYYWRVNAKNSTGISEWSDIWEVTTEPVGIPTLTAPEDNSIINPNQTTLEWNSINDADGYTLQVSLSEDFSSTIFNNENLTGTSFNISDLKWFSTYYWRVKATIDLCNSGWSEVWSFTPEASIPTDGLVAYYPFNGNANDESGNGHNGTISGATLTTDRIGSNNEAFYFDGNDDISINNNDELNLVGDMTISVWFYSEGPPAFSNAHCFISKLARDPTTAPYYFGINYQIGVPSDFNKALFVTAKNGTIQYLQSGLDITNNSWSHAVIVISGVNIKIFINNTLYLDTTIDNSLRVPNAAKVLIGSGNRNDAPAEYMKGKLDDLRIYNRALSAHEVQALFYE